MKHLIHNDGLFGQLTQTLLYSHFLHPWENPAWGKLNTRLFVSVYLNIQDMNIESYRRFLSDEISSS